MVVVGEGFVGLLDWFTGGFTKVFEEGGAVEAVELVEAVASLERVELLEVPSSMFQLILSKKIKNCKLKYIT